MGYYMGKWILLLAEMFCSVLLVMTFAVTTLSIFALSAVFCPSVFFYLLSVVPAIWLLELDEMELRIGKEQQQVVDNTTNRNLQMCINNRDIVFSVPGFKKTSWTSEQLIRLQEQLLLLILIVGRWLLPKGVLSHNQLSQLLMVYMGTAGDIVEFFDAFKEDAVRCDRLLCSLILLIWSWSLLQFTLVRTFTRRQTERNGSLMERPRAALRTNSTSSSAAVTVDSSVCWSLDSTDSTVCWSPEVFGIIVSILMQDAPFLVLRILLITKYGVLSYTNLFFTCKNTLVCMLSTYRLYVMQLEWCKGQYRALTGNQRNEELTSSSNSWTRSTLMHQSPKIFDVQHYDSSARSKSLREPPDSFDKSPVKYVIHKRYVDY